ncbi:hypothetical protein AKJ40_04025 [candidate division MSBL1 archaeon SCGC-AAA259M10]|uniref:EamA domain-containing protein n=1 Tax=candidate division MSBL1 archaeon SCGC-AAA259M10 TaxID=1698270 RepID=A0A133UXZ5_9EURY|nr:hypothetical protein AKJ40_04025 [candidate division MSBL1 archaeon SCGC-AAA259M10]
MILNELIGVLLGTSAAFFFALSLVFIRKATVSGESLEAVIVVTSTNLAIFLPVSLVFHYPDFDLTKESLLAFAGSGLIGSFLGRYCFFEGTRRIGASRMSPLSKGSLIIATLIGLLIFREAITTGHFFGIFILFIGIVLVGYEMRISNSKIHNPSRVDYLFPLAGMVFAGLIDPIVKFGLLENTPVTVGLAIRFIFGFIVIVFYFLSKGMSPLKPFRVKDSHLYIKAGIVNSFAQISFFSALSISRIVVVSPFKNISPLFMLFLSYLYLKRLEDITDFLIVGSVLVIGGAMLIGFFM